MSVKKSLWIALAVFMAIGLLFTGCPTESESSGGETVYTKTALWKAASAADILLAETQVSVLPTEATADGRDIIIGIKYVTKVQKEAFARAITEAKALAQAGVSGAAEEEAIKDLAKAQADFVAAKDNNKESTAEPRPASTVANGDLSAATKVVVVTESGTLPNLAIAGGTLIVAPGATVTTGATLELKGGGITVKSGGTFKVTDAGTKTVSAGTNIITVESGATYIDESNSRYAFFGTAPTGSATLIINAGAVIKLKSPDVSATTAEVLIGTSSGNNAGKIFQLTSGTLEAAYSGYTLNGTLTIVHDLQLLGFEVNTGTLTINKTVVVGMAGIQGNVSAAQVILGSGGRVLDKDVTFAAPPPATVSTAFPTATDVWTEATVPVAGIQTSGPAVFTWNGTDAWAKQP
jgi:hypothetical protein